MAYKITVVGEILNNMNLKDKLPKGIDKTILDTVIDDRRYTLRTDRFNYIWNEGSAELDDVAFFKRTRDNSYFNSFDALLRSIFKNEVKRSITRLETENILRAYENALSLATDIGSMLDAVVIMWGSLHKGKYCPKCHSELADCSEA